MTDLGNAAVTVAVAVVGVAILAVIVSRNAQTPAVLQSLGSAFSSILGVAVSPVTGGGGGFGSFGNPTAVLGTQFGSYSHIGGLY